MHEASASRSGKARDHNSNEPINVDNDEEPEDANPGKHAKRKQRHPPAMKHEKTRLRLPTDVITMQL